MSLSIKKCFGFLALDPSVMRQGSEGYEIVDKKAAPLYFYYSKEDAVHDAESFASLHPKIPVLVLQSIIVIEAKRPETHQKEFKDNGELLPSKPKD